jgi:hypothetical protein
MAPDEAIAKIESAFFILIRYFLIIKNKRFTFDYLIVFQ